MSYKKGGAPDFLRSESGAVSVDWVVLSASIVGIGLAAVIAVNTGATDMGAEMSYTMRAASIAGMAGSEFADVATVADLSEPVAAASVGYQPLVATPAEMEVLIQQLAASNDVATLTASYAQYAHQAAEMLAAGEHQAVPGFIDTVAAFEQALQRSGGTVPDGAPDVRELRVAYDQGTS